MIWAFIACFGVILLLLLVLLLRPRRQLRQGTPVNVAFVHPDLGIGGAERLVVDAAVALKQAGNTVTMYTARHDKQHCFPETRDGTVDVVVYGDFLPKRIAGRFYAACAYLRMCWVSLRVVLLSVLVEPVDVLIVDQVSICLPILLLAKSCGIIFYCHYPDYLLTQRASLLKKLYRLPLDFLEEITTGLADIIFVNSKFTRGVFAESFPILHRRGIVPDVLYPALNLEAQDELAKQASDQLDALEKDEQLLVSINRFERKKNIGLAIEAFAKLPAEVRQRTKLVLAGGYDKKLPENVEHAQELANMAVQLGVAERVKQMWSISSERKSTLLRHAACLLYTPDREHFGIVPVEGMYARVPVLAVNTGGPLESIVDSETGFLRPQEASQWADALKTLLSSSQMRQRLGSNGRQRAIDHFSLKAFGATLQDAINRLTQLPAEKKER